MLASQLKGDELWWRGSSWLTERSKDWPVTAETYRTPESLVEEKKSTTVMLTEIGQPSGIAAVIDVNDHSALQRIVNV